ncbi:MAG: LarC family nickel insertion protein, partial [Clostridiales bacterium]|nr:LarC family nickel insertion protein [Clostridiales bacterium]
MGNMLYLECFSGISGDMAVGALLDLGADPQVLMDALQNLPVDGFQVKISRVKKSMIEACDFDVILDDEHENHDHDMEYLHGHERKHSHVHEEESAHTHGEALHVHKEE